MSREEFKRRQQAEDETVAARWARYVAIGLLAALPLLALVTWLDVQRWSSEFWLRRLHYVIL